MSSVPSANAPRLDGLNPDAIAQAVEDGKALLGAYLRAELESGPIAALHTIRTGLPTSSPQRWLDCARCMIDADRALPAASLLQSAATQFPESLEVRYWLALALWHADQVAPAEAILRSVIATQPAFPEAAKQLAALLRGQGRMEAATAVMQRLHAVTADSGGRLDCVRFIESCQRQHRALSLIESDIDAVTQDPVVLVIAGKLALEVGRFELARTSLLAALHAGIDLNTWHIAVGLSDAQRYATKNHGDFALFESLLGIPALSPRGRAAVLFAIAKAHDDVGDYARAATALREANTLLRKARAWPRDEWCAQIEATLAAPAPSIVRAAPADWTPIFIVGLPRTGTTLLAELLGRHPDVHNRGEMPTLDFVARGLAASRREDDPLALDEAAALYEAHMRQDDAPARAYIDKNPMNFQHLGVIARLFPQACILHCRRDIRDTALSLWGHFFANDAYAFTRDFEDIAAFAAGHDRLMARWKRMLPQPVLEVDYEDLVAQPAGVLARIFEHAGLAPFDTFASTSRSDSVIATTSRWQARQPIYQRSVRRWESYAPYIPELTNVFRDGTSR